MKDALENLIRAQVVGQQATKDGIDKVPETAALLELTRLNVLQQAVAEIVSPNDSSEVKLQKIYAKVQQLRNTSYEVRKTEQQQKREKEKEAANVEEVWKRGYGDRMVLSHDCVCTIDWFASVPERDFGYIHREVLPRLSDAGMGDADIEHLELGAKALLLDSTVEAAMIREFHYEVRPALKFVEGIDVDDVGVIERSPCPRFAIEAVHHLFVIGHFLFHELHRDFVGSNRNRLRLFGSIVACTQCVLAAPNVSTRVKFGSTFPLGKVSGLSILK